ncbi:sterol desaturase family protein [Massilia sp. W12]|uniref:sterol desaturase family protein n=1 Tax=Massilia sp. W12 TaxID=3126507 RepID=UPI0030CCC591
MQYLSDLFATLQAWLFESLVQPAVFALGLGEFVETAFDGVEIFLAGLCELLLIYLLLRPLEAKWPVQPVSFRARANDFIYTVIHRLGVFAVLIFFLLDPLLDQLAALLHLQGLRPFNLENLWPGITDAPLVSFFVYLLILDFFDYWYHRMQHRFHWWWALHSLHHSQMEMNLWSDNRNHLLDDFLRDVVMGLIALAIGVPPAQYVMLVMAGRILQSLQHANLRLHFGPLEWLLVSPRFHRCHHAIGIGHEAPGGRLGGCNFAVLFPIWDMVFRSAHFSPEFMATGVRDQLPPPHGLGRDYGRGFWAQQWLGLRRLWQALRS